MNTKHAREFGKGSWLESVASTAFFLLAGVILWAGHMLLVYGPQSALCAIGIAERGDNKLITLIILLLTSLVLLIQLFILLKPQMLTRITRFKRIERSTTKFALSVSRTLTVLAMVGVAWSGSMAIFLEPCGALR